MIVMIMILISDTDALGEEERSEQTACNQLQVKEEVGCGYFAGRNWIIN